MSRRYLSSIRHFDAAFGSFLVAAVDRRAVADWVSARLAQGKLPCGNRADTPTPAGALGAVSHATVRRDLTALSSVLEACGVWGWADTNPALDYLRRTRERKRQPKRPPSRAEVEVVIAAAPAGVAGVLRLLLETGMRTSEAVSLERGQVDTARREVVLDRTKSSRPRVLPWVTVAGDATAALESGAARGVLYGPEDGRAFKNFSSNFAQVQRRLTREAASAGRPFVRFRAHDLRASFAVDWLRAGGSLERLSQHRGHGNTKITEAHYLDWLSAEQQEQVRRHMLRLSTDG